MKWSVVVLAATITGLADHHVVFTNRTGIPIARIEIDQDKYETHPSATEAGPESILISVTPHKHHLRLVFRGGAQVNWPKFDFHNVHEIVFERNDGHVEARTD